MNTQTLSCWLSANIFKYSSLFLVLLFSLQFSARAQSWQRVGEDDNNQASFTYISSASIVKNANNILYLPFIDNLNRRASVRRYTGTVWEQVGQTAVSDTVANIVSLAFDGNIPYVVYGGNELVVKKFDGTNWVTVVTEQLASPADMLSINIVNSIPYVLYRIRDANRSLIFKRIENGVFTTIATTDVMSGATDPHNYSIAFDGVTPYIAYKDFVAGGRSYVKKFNGIQWTDVGSYFELAGSDIMQLKINKGVPYLALWNYDTKPSVKYFDGRQWVFLGDTQVSDTSVSRMTLGFDNDTPYLLVQGGNPIQTYIYKYARSKWTAVGDAFYAKPDPRTSALALEFVNSMPYVFSLDYNIWYGKLRRYNGTGWELLESKGFSLGNTAGILDIKADKNNTPYVLYIDYTNSYRTTLARYNGLSWETVGAPGFSVNNSNVYAAALGFGADNNPIVTYAGGGENQQKVYMSRYDGAAWRADNNATLVLSSSVFSVKLAFDGSEPYAFYGIYGNLAIKKYNETTWITIGEQGFTGEHVSSADLKFYNHVPYVAYSETYDNNLSVLRLAGEQWLKVGNTINTQSNASYISLAFDNAGTPYLAHTGMTNTKLSVWKLNGENWARLGGEFNASRHYEKPSLFISAANQPVVSFRDANVNGRASSYKFNGTNWTVIGSAGFSAYETMPYTFVYNNKLHAVYAINKLYHKFFTGNYDLAVPTIQASNVKVSSILSTGARISWKNGNGSARAVFVKSGAFITPVPADGSSFTANTAFKSGSQLGTTGWYCIYNGTDTTVTVTGLTATADYAVAVIDYNGTVGNEIYYSVFTSGYRANFTTISTPTILKEGEWTWAGGYDAGMTSPVYGVKGVASPTNTPGARNNSGNWTDNAGNLWLYGGVGISPYGYDDLWKYDIQLKQWVWMAGSNTSQKPANFGIKGVASATNTPGARSYPATWVGSDGNLWLMGGEYFDGYPYTGFRNDLWKYDILTGLWTWVSGNQDKNAKGIYGTKGIPNSENFPSGRAQSAYWTDNDGGLWLMGGRRVDSTTTLLNDVWRFDTKNNQWTWIGGSNLKNQNGTYGLKGVESADNMPGARYGAAFWQDNAGSIWLLGGTGYGKTTFVSPNDFWKFNMSTRRWTWVGGEPNSSGGSFGTKGVYTASNQPSGRTGGMTWTDKFGNLWLMGGQGSDRNSRFGFLNDLWMYNKQSSQWVWLNGGDAINQVGTYNTLGTPSANGTPGGRSFAVNWVNTDGTLWLYGGLGFSKNYQTDRQGDIWAYKPPFLGPNINASKITLSDVTFTQAKITWKKGNGEKRVLFVKKGTYGTIIPTNGTTYVANAEFGKSPVNSTDWYCIYNGADSVVTVNGLIPNTRYQVFVAEYIGNVGQELYNSISVTGNPANFSTALALTNLVPSKGTLLPAFLPTILNYNINMPLGSTAIQFTPTVDTSAVIKIQDKVVQSGKLSDSISIKYGSNIIPVTVTLGELSTTYNITVKVGYFASELNFTALPDKTYGDAPFAPGASSNNNETPITYTSSNNEVAQIVNGKIKIIRNGTVRITASQAAGNGHNAAVPVTQNLTVNKAQLIVKAKNKNRIYGTGNGTLTFTYTGFVNGDTQAKLTGGLPVASVNATASSPVGTYDITPVVNTSYFYELVPEAGILTVTKAPLTVTTNPASRFYGAANPVITLKYTGFVNNDGVSKLTVRPTATIQADVLSVPGKYPVTVSGGEAQNYEFTYVPGTITVNKANLFITAKSRIITYGAAFPSLTLTYSGFVNSEKAEQVFNTMPVVNSTATPSSPAGNYPITVLGGTSSKYVLHYTTGTFTINKAVLQVTARNQTREQYQSNPEFTLRYSGFVNGDTETMLRTIPQGSTNATTNSPVGQYAINVSGGYSPYYTFNYTAGVLTVTKATSSSFARTSSEPDDLVVHSAVSPNGDGQNDYWQIDNIEKYTDNQVMILTNAGKLIYQAKGYDNYNQRFDGYSSGSRVKQQPGTYMYVINYTVNGEQKKKAGYLMIK